MRAFIDDFLAPIAADGRLDQKEETPLLAAYCAYGIHELQSVPEGRIDGELREAIQNAAARVEQVDGPRNLTGAWRRILDRANRITRGDFEKLRTWFREEGVKLRSEDAFSETPPDAEFLQLPVDAQMVSKFH
ncbi:MAG TPA: hypothetical protein VGN42_03310, partial [Pirellulales bacterium]|nr:hypothetical protein [Pirellulales bacterium]